MRRPVRRSFSIRRSDRVPPMVPRRTRVSAKRTQPLRVDGRVIVPAGETRLLAGHRFRPRIDPIPRGRVDARWADPRRVRLAKQTQWSSEPTVAAIRWRTPGSRSGLTPGRVRNILPRPRPMRGRQGLPRTRSRPLTDRHVRPGTRTNRAPDLGYALVRNARQGSSCYAPLRPPPARRWPL